MNKIAIHAKFSGKFSEVKTTLTIFIS